MNRIDELKALLLTWRRAEKQYALAMTACDPRHINASIENEKRALDGLRQFVDSAPWNEL